MSKKRLLIAGFSILMLFLCCTTNAQAQNDSSCVPSSCGDIAIRYPFILKNDPIDCGHHDNLFTLDCKQNRTILSSQSHHYIVETINYNNFTMHVVDPGLDRDNYSSCPIYSWYEISSSNLYLSWVQTITLVNCLRVVNNSFYIENPFCGNKSTFSNSSVIYSYFVVGSILVSELDESCTFDTVAQASPDVPLPENASYRDVHDFLSFGFDLNWFNAMCGECDAKKATCTFEDGQIRCRHYCFEDTPLSERTFLCKLEYYAPYIILIVLPVIGVIIFLRLLCVLPILIRSIRHKWRRRHSLVDDELIEEILKHGNNLMPIRYSYSEIKKMVKDFKDKLGEGSSGTVYKGKLRSGPLVAIKTMSDSIESGREFIGRVARIGRIRHANVVKLIGFCIEGSKRALVYEFMPNGSLEKYMYAQEGTISLTYEQMLDISLGMARGIDYLHNESQHVDIKPHNILLDQNFNPKIISQYTLDDTGEVSCKSDVSDFGMMLMEMVQRRRNMNPFGESLSQGNFLSWVYDRQDEKGGVDMKDATEEERKMTKKIIIVALWCIQTRPEDRPPMSKIVEMLEANNGELQMPPKSLLTTSEITKNDKITY